MNIVIDFVVNGQWIKSTIKSLVSNSVNVYTAKFSFTSEWNEYTTKSAVFMTNNGINIVQPIFDNECVIPWESINQDGNLKIGVFGVSGEGTNIVRYPTVWTQNIQILAGVKYAEKNPPTLSQYEQFVSRIHSDMENAKEYAISANLSASEAKQIVDSIQALTPEEVQQIWDTVKNSPDTEPEPEPMLLSISDDEVGGDIPVESISLDQTNISVSVGEYKQLVATVLPENATDKTIKWSTSDVSVSVSNDGKVYGVSVGNATIKAEIGNVFAECFVEVVDPVIQVDSITLNKTGISIVQGKTAELVATIHPLNATNQEIKWSSSNEDIAVVYLGNVVALEVGEVEITAECDGKTATCVVTVTKSEEPVIKVEQIIFDKESVELDVGENDYIKATIVPANATDQNIFWITSNNNVAVTNGALTGVKEGQCIVTARCGGKSADCIVMVNPVKVQSVNVSPVSMILTPYYTGTLNAVVKPDNATNKTIVWTSSDETICTVANGIVTSTGKLGTATITATVDDVFGTCEITVKEIVERKFLDSIGLQKLVENIIEDTDGYDKSIEDLKTLTKQLENDMQQKISGSAGQFVGFNENGEPIAVDANPGPEGPEGPQGKQGEQGPPGENGKDATINGISDVDIVAGENISIKQSGNSLKISAYDSVFPDGAIIVWRGDYHNPPQGWVACDGQNNTPDLRDRFVIVGAYTICYIMKVGE